MQSSEIFNLGPEQKLADQEPKRFTESVDVQLIKQTVQNAEKITGLQSDYSSFKLIDSAKVCWF